MEVINDHQIAIETIKVQLSSALYIIFLHIFETPKF